MSFIATSDNEKIYKIKSTGYLRDIELLFTGIYNFSGIETITMNGISAPERTSTFIYKARLKNVPGSGYIPLWTNQTHLGTFRWIVVGIYDDTGTNAKRVLVSLINTDSPDNKIRVLSNAVLSIDDFQDIVVTYDGSSTAAGITIEIDTVDETGTIVNDTLSDTVISANLFRVGKRFSDIDRGNVIMDSYEFWLDGIKQFETNCDDNGDLTSVDLSGQGNDGVIDLDVTERNDFFTITELITELYSKAYSVLAKGRDAILAAGKYLGTVIGGIFGKTFDDTFE